MAKKLVNKKLIGFLMEHRKIEIITVDKSHVVAQCKKNFMPGDLKPMLDEIGQEPKLTTSGGINYIIFNRY